MKSRESMPKREMKETKSPRNTAIALIAALAGAGAMLKERFESPETPTKAKEEQQLSKEELRDLRNQLDTAEKLATILGAASQERPATPIEDEFAPGDFRSLTPSKEDLKHFPGAYLEMSTAEAMNLDGYSNKERAIAKALSGDLELKADFLQTLEELKIDVDSNSIHVYLPSDKDFNLTFAAADEDMSRIMMSDNNGESMAALGPDAATYSENDAKAAIQQGIQEAVWRHLSE